MKGNREMERDPGPVGWSHAGPASRSSPVGVGQRGDDEADKVDGAWILQRLVNDVSEKDFNQVCEDWVLSFTL